VRVLHFSTTPLAGMPVRLVQALNRWTGIDARLADLNRFGLYDHDLAFSESPDQIQQLAAQADIIHLHNYLDLDSRAFAPLNFRELAAQGKRIVRQFHSTPQLVAQVMGITPEALLAQDIPCLAIAQYPERLYPRAMVVPNFVPETMPLYAPDQGEPLWDVFYSHTKDLDAWEDRWSTKGAPQVLAMLARLERERGLRVRTATGLPLDQVLALKRKSRVVLDDLVTGSYHLTGLEGLAQGKAVLARLDERSLALLRRFSGADAHPFLNVRLEDAPEVLAALAADPDLTRELGAASRRWLEEHWPERRMVEHYAAAYDLLLEDPALVRRQPELALSGRADSFLARDLPDLIQAARAARWRGHDI